ncbi:MAG: LuxR C-terminal-related transcriptional regulator [Cyclobacteriaceae bacterium]
MKQISHLNRLYRADQPENYLSPNELGVQWTYEASNNRFIIAKHKKIAGYEPSEIDTLDKFIGLTHPDDLNGTFNFSKSLITFLNKCGVKVGEHKSSNVFRAKGKGGKLYYFIRHGIANGEYKGELTSNLSYIEDVTWMRPKPGSWRVIGPHTSSFDFELPEVQFFHDRLSSREIEVLRLVARGFRSSEIGNMLHISPYTVATHRKNMIRKLEVNNTPELMTLSRDMGLI